jgi:hypothetical protein
MTYIFDHIFKTGGTTFNLSYLSAAFQPEEIFIVRGFRDANRQDIEHLIGLPESEKAKLKVVAGHKTGRLRVAFRQARFITMLRDPVERAISGYLHARLHPDARDIIGQTLEDKRIGLAEFVERDMFASYYADFVSLHNWQAQTVLGNDIPSDVSEKTIADRLKKRFYLVGYTEALELFIVFLHVTAGFPLVLFNNRLVRKERSTFEATARDIQTIKRWSQLDALVYRYARREFDRRMAEIWSHEVQALYREYISALTQYREQTAGDYNIAPVRFVASVCRA